MNKIKNKNLIFKASTISEYILDKGPTMSDTQPSKGSAKSTMSKKRFHDISTQVHEKCGDNIQLASEIMEIIKNVMQFDVNASAYTPEHGARIKARLQKLKEEGISTYISGGRKASYYKKKQEKENAKANQ